MAAATPCRPVRPRHRTSGHGRDTVHHAGLHPSGGYCAHAHHLAVGAADMVRAAGEACGGREATGKAGHSRQAGEGGVGVRGRLCRHEWARRGGHAGGRREGRQALGHRPRRWTSGSQTATRPGSRGWGGGTLGHCPAARIRGDASLVFLVLPLVCCFFIRAQGVPRCRLCTWPHAVPRHTGQRVGRPDGGGRAAHQEGEVASPVAVGWRGCGAVALPLAPALPSRAATGALLCSC